MSDTTEIKALVIHLSRARARRAQVDGLVAACPAPVEVMEAVDGRAMSKEQVDAVYSLENLHSPRYPFKLGVGEVGCFLSHRKAWEAVLDSGREAGLVIEDDVEMEAAVFSKALELARAHIGKHGIIQFQVRDIANPGPVIAESNDVRLTQPVVVPLRASCTLYSRSALEQLLDQTRRFDRPVDTYLQMRWLTGLHPLLVIPSGVRDKGREVGGTTIQASNKTFTDRVVRAVLRPLYRTRIAALSHAAKKSSS
jgi:glycosyl transferase family 25